MSLAVCVLLSADGGTCAGVFAEAGPRVRWLWCVCVCVCVCLPVCLRVSLLEIATTTVMAIGVGCLREMLVVAGVCVSVGVRLCVVCASVSLGLCTSTRARRAMSSIRPPALVTVTQASRGWPISGRASRRLHWEDREHEQVGGGARVAQRQCRARRDEELAAIAAHGKRVAVDRALAAPDEGGERALVGSALHCLARQHVEALWARASESACDGNIARVRENKGERAEATTSESVTATAKSSDSKQTKAKLRVKQDEAIGKE